MKPSSNSIRRAQPLLGTFVEIEASGAPQSDMNTAISAAFQVIAKVHRLMSFHEMDSDVQRLNRHASLHAVSIDPWTYQVLESALAMHRASAGIFDIAVAPVMQKLSLLPSGMNDSPCASAVICGSSAIELLLETRIR